MSKIRDIPPILLARAAWLTLRGRVHLVRDAVGEIQQGKDEDFKIFRKVVIDPSKSRPENSGAILIVRFRFARFGPTINRCLSLIPIPFIVAQPGFRSKTWMMGQETQAFQGVYEWDSVSDARKYWTSFPMRLMKRRAIPETLTHEINGV